MSKITFPAFVLTLLAGSITYAAYPADYWNLEQDETNLRIKYETDSTTEVGVFTSDGKMGIGTTAPGYTLDVSSGSNYGIGITSSNSQFGLILNGTATGAQSWGIYSTQAGATEGDGNLVFKNFSSDSVAIFINQTGSMGIGTSVPTQKLQVSGNIVADKYLYTSDNQLKTNVAPLVNSRDLLQINGVSYNRLDSEAREIGVIAQQVEQYFPSVVETNPETGLKSVDYVRLIAPMLELLREQDARIRVLESHD